ncbi:MAG: tetratricopeptide repeat protein [Phycisphaerales bacterium]|nr:tetratricopeptide repeat protein [Phycisphaerales bacterium]
MAGCVSQQSRGPYAPVTAGDRDTAKATALNAEATKILERADATSDPRAMKRAEELLREALSADLYFGPAHNNLGAIFLARGELYNAASEFEWARKLMPGHPDPRVNLAITLESAGRIDDAMATYRTALEVLPDDIAAMQGLTRLQVRTGRRDQETARMLSEIAMRGETKQWRDWAIEAGLARGVGTARGAGEP